MAAKAAAEGETASTWPDGHDINIVVAYGAGTDGDTVTRMLAPYLGEVLGCNVVVTNVSGGNGSIAMEEVMNSDDGYTFLDINTASLSANCVTGLTEYTYKDMEAVGINATYSGETIYARKDAPFDTLEEFIDYAKENNVTIAVSMGGAVYAACMALSAEGLKIDMIDEGDGAQRILAAANGSVDCTFASYSVGRDYVENGDIKQIATLMADRITAEPDMPSVSEYMPDVIVNTLFVLLAPKGTDPEVCKIMNDALLKVYAGYPEYAEQVSGYTYQTAEPMNIEDTLVQLEKQYQLFQNYSQYLN